MAQDAQVNHLHEGGMSDVILLQNHSPDHSLTIFHLEPGTFVLGRSAQCDFIVNDASISRRHAAITFLDGCVTVKDLESSNGTFLDGKRIKESRVNLGQSIRFGKVAFTIASQKGEDIHFGPEEETDKCVDLEGFLGSGGPDLSLAQSRVFNQLLQGLDEKQIAKQLFISPHTVHNHLRVIYRKYQVHSRLELLAKILGKKAGN